MSLSGEWPWRILWRTLCQQRKNRHKTTLEKPRANKSKVSCGVSLRVIVNGRDKAVYCEGECQQWYHRGCASVPQALLDELTSSEEPFLCIMCSCATFKLQLVELSSIVCPLQAELKVPAIRENIAALKEVSNLHKNQYMHCNSVNKTNVDPASYVSKAVPPKTTKSNLKTMPLMQSSCHPDLP